MDLYKESIKKTTRRQLFLSIILIRLGLVKNQIENIDRKNSGSSVTFLKAIKTILNSKK